MAKPSQGIRTNVGKVDKLKTSWASIRKQEQSLDINPHKSTKKAKVKERQVGKKESILESWYCDKCAVEVAQFRCKYCGKSEQEES